MKVNAYAAYSKGEELKPYEFDLAEPRSNEVQIKIKYCGLCHSDLHLITNDWHISKFPLVPGHEILGEVVAIGKDVTKFSEGAKVGVGWQCGSCGTCNSCRKGMQNICSDMVGTCVDGLGGFAEYINVNQDFVFEIPANLFLPGAAPLLCGGITVYNPLEYYNVRPWMKVGIIGMGGLGHLAIKFAKAMGCEVTVFSSSSDKEIDARNLGADDFVTDINEEGLENSLDFILSTVSVNLDWNRYLDILKDQGKLCFVGAIDEDLKVNFFNLMPGQKEIVTGSIGSPLTIEQMLDFASRHNISAEVETFKLDEVNKAIEKLKKNQIRYRAVLEL